MYVCVYNYVIFTTVHNTHYTSTSHVLYMYNVCMQVYTHKFTIALYSKFKTRELYTCT